ncbi:hypothetical protein EU805_16025 [Salipiger sp. IMCC34102]|uniref:hypothetical protein n=1 Tax=Salipiger sp. IMCC34102 TaxID=2510647 RepID=UPI00101BE6D0|nr:hypothetical protein [Salipiger sp. IMCC34102]RYH00962.1 hypothetical protein EU805_16025 [Salipiger sp. IMCC34102]
MPPPNTRATGALRLPADLDAGTVTTAHADLVSLLDEAERSELEVSLDLEPDDAAVSPLSLQLLASAARSFPADRLTMGPAASAALAVLDRPKEI